MAAANNKKILVGGIVLAVVVVLIGWGLTTRGGGDKPTLRNEPLARETEATGDLEPSSAASRSSPAEDARSGGRLTGASDEVSGADDATRDDGAVKKKTKRAKKRGRSRKKRSDQSEEEDENKGAGKGKVVPRPF